MGWFDIGDGLLGGDDPLDAYGAATTKIAKRVKKDLGRLPSLAELVRAFDRTTPREPSSTYDALERALEGDAPPSRMPARLRSGELLEVPYADGRALVALVLFGDGEKGGPGYGPCVVALDLDVSALDSLERARTSRWLTRPSIPAPARRSSARSDSGAWRSRPTLRSCPASRGRCARAVLSGREARAFPTAGSA